MVKITLVKSLIGAKANQKLTAESLGLKKIGDFTIQEDSPILAGKIRVLSHLIEVENPVCE